VDDGQERKSGIPRKGEKVSLYLGAGLLVLSPRASLRVVSGKLGASAALGEEICLLMAGDDGAMLAFDSESPEGIDAID